jgi:hypothetical protein
MHEIQSQIEIAASAERVWSILMDFPAYPAWNPFIRSITGVAEKGRRISISIQPPSSSAMTFRATILQATPQVELRWLGHLLFRGIFDGEHYFQIAPGAAGRVRFTQGEKFSGLIVGLVKARLDQGTKAGFIAMNEALKSRAENGSEH